MKGPGAWTSKCTRGPRQVSHMIASQGRSTLLSLALHAAAIALLVLASRIEPSTLRPGREVAPPGRDIGKYVALVAPRGRAGGGGGAGGSTPASRGRLPRFALRQFTPPAAVIRNQDPQLAMEPTLVGNPLLIAPVSGLPQYGDPNAPPGPPSGGRGSGGGIGDGREGGVGNGKGPGYGDNEGGGMSGTSRIVYSATAPVLLYKVEPEYADEARRARVQGIVILRIEVDPEGRPGNVTVRQSLGLGLDERAVEAVRKWKFRPGYAGGKAVATAALVVVTFRLL
jgi:periplasmic protein TonB